MFDHIQIKVKDFHQSRAFYQAVLGTLGYGVVFEDEGVTGFGPHTHNMFEVRQADETLPISQSIHVAFVAKSQDAVRAFYVMALEHGAKDNGAPGLRSHYEDGYFAAFVIDHDGHNIEAVYSPKS